MKINLTRLEIEILLNTAGQMADNMDYFNFQPKALFKKHKQAYKSGMDKLLKTYKYNKEINKIRKKVKTASKLMATYNDLTDKEKDKFTNLFLEPLTASKYFLNLFN